MRAKGIVPQLPPNPAPYLTDWLFQIGPSVPAGMSVGPIGWQDIGAWQAAVGIELLPWEAATLRKLSAEFVSESHRAKKVDCPPPWVPGREMTLNRDAISRQVGIAFKSLMLSQGTRRGAGK